MLGASSLLLRDNLWYNSSVTNGMNGCNRRKPASRQVYKMFFATDLASSFNPYKTGFKLS